MPVTTTTAERRSPPPQPQPLPLPLLRQAFEGRRYDVYGSRGLRRRWER